MKVVQEPNKPVAFIPHPVKVPQIASVLRHPEFDTKSELGSIYNKFKERAKERKWHSVIKWVIIQRLNGHGSIAGFDIGPTEPKDVAPHSCLPDVNKPLPKRSYIPTYHKQTWKQSIGGFKPKSSVAVIN